MPNRIALVLELFRRTLGDFCYQERNNKQKESTYNRIYTSKNIDAQELIFRLKKWTVIV